MKSYKKYREMMNLMYNAHTGEQVNPVRVYCACGHSMHFLSNCSAICDYCGRKVYPTKEAEFKEKLEVEMRKNK